MTQGGITITMVRCMVQSAESRIKNVHNTIPPNYYVKTVTKNLEPFLA